MANKKLTEEEMNHLRASHFVLEVSPSMIHFSAKFKEMFWKSIQEGKGPRDVVIELGIDPDILGEYRLNGLKSMIRNEVRAGKGFRDLQTYGSYLKDYTDPDAKVKYLEQQLAYKDQEIEFLKKNCIFKPGGFGIMNVPASAKYAIIREMTQRDNNLLNIVWLCAAAGVSRSGYYHYIETADLRRQREEQDHKAFLIILEAYRFRGYDKGARGIYMRLLHMDPPEHMNIKKIRRLMNKYGLRCPIRKANPYRRMAKALRTSNVAPNLLNREFETHGPRTVLLTDISYIINGKAPRCYMSTIIDACTKELLAWVLSESLEIDFVLETVNQIIENHGISLTTETLINSDQGAHYTSIKFIQLIKDSELRQSMSRKANCWDNAPQESFYGHMKDEIDISQCKTFEEIHRAISDWTDYYNIERYQWDLARLSPREYRNAPLCAVLNFCYFRCLPKGEHIS